MGLTALTEFWEAEFWIDCIITRDREQFSINPQVLQLKI